MKFFPLSLLTKKFFLYSLGILAIFSYIFAKFADELVEKELHTFDLQIIHQVQGLITPQLTSVMKFFTFMGSIKMLLFLFLLSCLFMLWRKKVWEAIFLLLAIGGGTVFNLFLKWVFQRARPTLHPIIQETGYSFPSGHSMVSFIFYGMIGYFLLLFFERRVAKAISVVFISVLVFMIGLSRIYLGVHYPSDVIAGFAAGGAWLVICIMGLRVMIERGSR
ncbi:phosphatase PAP2 family protein [Aneurinibacillus aneurinilyticus]|jgi:undecaprenyl-diphosphatase|uniref:Phosphatase PAP2 family protein n=1 Tax=Aneurinibacillus aneurinilyticus TaxID=1391 RepID=A0A848CUJ0_ANEAE|nr:phosphatase PAP2 family protein [Aneurinibacillus aneurinilyticus]MCI1694887.1 phosphatase PAP2 family protein [Aneurinibacillus aneurinilyticus]NME98631.1 phosphatase PAP2 family protein [Aneurinibacillus aneurinilyticus]